jgi:myo-inositol 2-dehydrogenase / D-chiro-inositol 1-dehydrogenase
MRFGLIGYGAWGRHHAAAFGKAPGATLGAIACRSEATAAAARHDCPGVPVHRDYRELLARPDLDAVDIVVPNHLHAEIGVAALEAGKDVLLEKPMASTPGECDRLIQAARASGRVLSIGHEFRLSTQWSRIKALLDAGEIGEPMYALVSLFRFPYRRGSEGWRYDADRVGSWILEEPVHFFDSVMWYFERWGDPVTVLAAGNARDARPGAAMADNFSALVRFPGQLYAVITQTLAGFEHHHVMEVVGSEGAVRTWWSGAMDRTRAPAFELKVRRHGAAEAEVVPLAPSGEVFELEEEIRGTVAAFRARRPLVSGEEARKRIVVCREAERSLREGREVLLTF